VASSVSRSAKDQTLKYGSDVTSGTAGGLKASEEAWPLDTSPPWARHKASAQLTKQVFIRSNLPEENCFIEEMLFEECHSTSVAYHFGDLQAEIDVTFRNSRLRPEELPGRQPALSDP
jgi:hypothetical protein